MSDYKYSICERVVFKNEICQITSREHCDKPYHNRYTLLGKDGYVMEQDLQPYENYKNGESYWEYIEKQVRLINNKNKYLEGEMVQIGSRVYKVLYTHNHPSLGWCYILDGMPVSENREMEYWVPEYIIEPYEGCIYNREYFDYIQRNKIPNPQFYIGEWVKINGNKEIRQITGYDIDAQCNKSPHSYRFDVTGIRYAESALTKLADENKKQIIKAVEDNAKEGFRVKKIEIIDNGSRLQITSVRDCEK